MRKYNSNKVPKNLKQNSNITNSNNSLVNQSRNKANLFINKENIGTKAE